MGTGNEKELQCGDCEARTTYERLAEEELANLGIVLGAYRSFRGNRRKHIAYVGMPITSGKRFYEVLFAAGVKTAEEFIEKYGKDAFFADIIKKNMEEGVGLADTLGKKKDLLFIAPSVFEAKKWRWTQDAYMSLWYRVLGELAGRHVVMNGWEYSTGGLQEVLFSLSMQWGLVRPGAREGQSEGLQNFHPGLDARGEEREYEAMRKMRVYDSSFKEIRLDDALVKAFDAVATLEGKGFDVYETLLRTAAQLAAIPDRSRERKLDAPYKLDKKHYKLSDHVDTAWRTYMRDGHRII